MIRPRTLTIAAFLVLASPGRADVSVTDDAGRTVELAEPAERIISLAPHVTELLFAVDAGDRVVGTVEYADFPEAAKEIPRIGDAFRVDMERVAGLEPDLAVSWGSGNPESLRTRLRELGIPVLTLEPDTLDDIAEHLDWLGRVAGRPGEGGRQARRFRERLAELAAEYRDREPVRVFFQISAEPLFTVGGTHTIDDVIRLCGGRNVFADLEVKAPTVDVEGVLARDPQALVTTGRAASSDDDSPEDALAMWRQWSDLSAVRHGNLTTIHADHLSRSTSRILAGAEAMCRFLARSRERLRESPDQIRQSDGAD